MAVRFSPLSPETPVLVKAAELVVAGGAGLLLLGVAAGWGTLPATPNDPLWWAILPVIVSVSAVLLVSWGVLLIVRQGWQLLRTSAARSPVDVRISIARKARPTPNEPAGHHDQIAAPPSRAEPAIATPTPPAAAGVARAASGEATFRIGPASVPYTVITVVLPYDARDIHVRYQPGLYSPLPEIVSLREQLVREIEERAARDPDYAKPHNSLKWKVVHFNYGSRRLEDGDEHPELHILFTDTDYYSQMVTNNAVHGSSVRDAFMSGVDLAVEPVNEFASVFGVTIAVVTKDRKLVLMRRSQQTQIGPGQLAVVSEGGLRPRDGGASGGPDPYKVARRALVEELGVDGDRAKVSLLSFGVDSRTAIYNMIGRADVEEPYDEIVDAWRSAPPQDKWEHKRAGADITSVEFSPDAFASYWAKHGSISWSPVSFVAAILALQFEGHQRADIATAMTRASDRWT